MLEKFFFSRFGLVLLHTCTLSLFSLFLLGLAGYIVEVPSGWKLVGLVAMAVTTGMGWGILTPGPGCHD